MATNKKWGEVTDREMRKGRRWREDRQRERNDAHVSKKGQEQRETGELTRQSNNTG